MLVFAILAAIRAHYTATPRHTLVIATRTSPYHLDSFPFTQLGPYKNSTEPILFSRAFNARSSVSEEKKSEEEGKDNLKKQLSGFMSMGTICKVFSYVLIAVLIFFTGYQTRKFHEGRTSYVRLPTRNN